MEAPHKALKTVRDRQSDRTELLDGCREGRLTAGGAAMRRQAAQARVASRQGCLFGRRLRRPAASDRLKPQKIEHCTMPLQKKQKHDVSVSLQARTGEEQSVASEAGQGEQGMMAAAT